MLKEAITPKGFGSPEQNGQGNGRGYVSLKQIFEKQESMLYGLNPEQMAYLEFLHKFRIARMEGNEERMDLLMKKIDREEAIRMANKLKSQREIIINATQLFFGEVSIEDSNIDLNERRQVLEHLLSD